MFTTQLRTARRYGASGSGRTSVRATKRFVRRLDVSAAATMEGATSSERLSLLLRVYETVAGSDRGFSYRNNADKRRSVVEAVDDLIRSSPVDRCTVESGLWRLVYSTNFGSDEITRVRFGLFSVPYPSPDAVSSILFYSIRFREGQARSLRGWGRFTRGWTGSVLNWIMLSKFPSPSWERW